MSSGYLPVFFFFALLLISHFESRKLQLFAHDRNLHTHTHTHTHTLTHSVPPMQRHTLICCCRVITLT